jgi:heptosyltransferase II
MREESPTRIVVFCLPGIGDAVLFTPALALLRHSFPRARITAVTMFRGAADLLETNPDLDEVRCLDFPNAATWQGLRYTLRGMRSLWALRRDRFELSVVPFPANRIEYNLLNRLIGRRWRAAHRYRHHRWRTLSFLNNITVGESGTLHNLEENVAVVRAICRRLGVAPADPEARLRVHLTADDLQRAERFLAARGLASAELLIGLHTYSSTFKNMHRKCWDKERFVELIRRTRTVHPGAQWLIFCGPSDVAVSQYVMQRAGDGVHLVEQENLRWALAILRRCRLFVSNDSGLMHLAGALGVPVVALFGPTDWRRLRPWAAPYRVVRQDLPCMPCFYYSSRPLRCAAGLDYACMRDLAVEPVFGAMQSLLAQSPAAA